MVILAQQPAIKLTTVNRDGDPGATTGNKDDDR
jgi:hypothetical protein